MVEIEVNKYYSNRAYYPYIPVSVFNALEAAYLSGAATVSIPVEEYNKMNTAISNATNN